MTIKLDPHLEDLRTAVNVLGVLSEGLDNYPGNEYAQRVRSAFTAVNFLVIDYALRCARGLEPFDALGEALAAMEDETGINAVRLSFRRPTNEC